MKDRNLLNEEIGLEMELDELTEEIEFVKEKGITKRMAEDIEELDE